MCGDDDDDDMTSKVDMPNIYCTHMLNNFSAILLSKFN